MNIHYSFKSVFDQGEKLIGEKVSIDAVLVIQGAEAYLVESVQIPDSFQRIPVHCPNLESQLDSNVGGWMGSGYSYIDPVRINGKLEAGTVRKNKLVLSDVTELSITRDGELTTVVMCNVHTS
jgi:NADPH-dependent curcumin reductase CurA